jgi:sugar phosphate isomerase/epimerase
MISRRNFLVVVGASFGSAVCRTRADTPGLGTSSAGKRKLDRIGIQLYSVRQEMQRDMPATLARIADIGYREVEFAGYFGRTPAQVRQLLDQNHLSAPSTHLGFDLLGTDKWDKALDDAAAIGHEYATIAWIPENLRKDWRRIADQFNQAGEAARKKGLRFAYHNHDFELKSTEATKPLDILLANTDPALVSYEMDVYWVTFAGADPKAYLRQYPTRFAMLHLKDSAGPPDNKMVDVGTGKIDFAGILRLDADQRQSVKHVFVEHDQPADPFAFAKNSFDFLKKLEY